MDAQAIERLVGKKTIRARDLQRHGLPSAYLGRLVRQGRLVRHSRGIYAPAKQEISGTHDYEIACLRVPHGVLCLLSALAYHGIGTQNPHEIWMAIDGKAWRPRLDHPPMRFMRFSRLALSHGVMSVSTSNGIVRVYTPAKTVADCFKFRNKCGIDIAIEALREGWRYKKFTMKQLDEAAQICRVSRIIRPYLEMLT
jgi:predicted transcriptional regulator of viral defense system